MNRTQPVYTQHGAGPLQAVVLSPVLPVWDEGRFFAPLVQPLIDSGYRVSVFDTLSLLPDAALDMDAFAARWSAHLSAFGRIDLLAGGALGGALVQAMLGEPWAAAIPKVLLISAPSVADALLDTRLGSLAELARRGDVARALTMLDWLVAPQGTPAPDDAPSPSPSAAGRAFCPTQANRLSRGFGLLAALDVRAAVNRYAGRLLNVYGERSQLVRRCNVHLGNTSAHTAHGIPNGGMRPLTDDLTRVCAALRAHLDIAAPLPQPH